MTGFKSFLDSHYTKTKYNSVTRNKIFQHLHLRDHTSISRRRQQQGRQEDLYISNGIYYQYSKCCSSCTFESEASSRVPSLWMSGCWMFTSMPCSNRLDLQETQNIVRIQFTSQYKVSDRITECEVSLKV